MRVFHNPTYQCSECNAFLDQETLPGRFPSEPPVVKVTHPPTPNTCSEAGKIVFSEPLLMNLFERPGSDPMRLMSERR